MFWICVLQFLPLVGQYAGEIKDHCRWENRRKECTKNIVKDTMRSDKSQVAFELLGLDREFVAFHEAFKFLPAISDVEEHRTIRGQSMTMLRVFWYCSTEAALPNLLHPFGNRLTAEYSKGLFVCLSYAYAPSYSSPFFQSICKGSSSVVSCQ